jgi:hypothetical protein
MAIRRQGGRSREDRHQLAGRKKKKKTRAGEIDLRDLEKVRRAERLSRRKEIDGRIAAYRAQVKRPRGGRRTLGGPARAAAKLQLLAEGDSWFDFPKVLGTGGDILDHLEGAVDVGLLNLAHHGDEVRGMLGHEQRNDLIQALQDPDFRFDAILFSGGGNDLVGDPMSLWLRRRESGVTPAKALRIDRLRGALAIVRAGYEDLIAIRDEHAPGAVIFTHGYDFPKPRDQGVCGLGPWLWPSLVDFGWKQAEEQYQIAKHMLLELDALLVELEKNSRDLVYVRTQEAIPRAAVWHDEIHPHSAGFARLADRFRTALESRFPGRT